MSTRTRCSISADRWIEFDEQGNWIDHEGGEHWRSSWGWRLFMAASVLLMVWGLVGLVLAVVDSAA